MLEVAYFVDTLEYCGVELPVVYVLCDWKDENYTHIIAESKEEAEMKANQKGYTLGKCFEDHASFVNSDLYK